MPLAHRICKTSKTWNAKCQNTYKFIEKRELIPKGKGEPRTRGGRTRLRSNWEEFFVFLVEQLIGAATYCCTK